MASFAQRRSSGLGVRTSTSRRASSQHSRRSSQNSVGMPSPASAHIDGGLNDLGAGGDLGASLADELAEDWDEGDVGEGEYEEQEYLEDMETAAPGSPAKTGSHELNGHAQGVLGSYGPDEDDVLMATESFTPYLEKCMADVEALATVQTDGSDKAVWDRGIAQLRNLPPQTKLDDASERLKTASKKASENLEKAIREWPQVTRAITTPWAASWQLEPWDMEDIEALVSAVIESLPHPPNLSVLEAIREVNMSNSEVMSALSSITDQTHMQSQASTKAAQRLKAVRDVVIALRHEMDLGEEGAVWLERGNWNERIKGREAARVCEDVVGGFDEVCNQWRSKLVEQAGGGSNGVTIDAGAN